MKNRLTWIKSPIRKKIRNSSPFRYIIRNKSPPPPPSLPPPKYHTTYKFSVYNAEHIPLKYTMQNISPPQISPPNVNIADQIPLQVKIRNTRFRSDLVGKFSTQIVFFSVFFKLTLDIHESPFGSLGKISTLIFCSH